MNQKTLAQEVKLSGIGLHTGQIVNVVIKPAAVNYGVKFTRVDLEKPVKIAGEVEKVVSTQRSTTIGTPKATVSTIEHLLAAATALGLDNLDVEIDGPEVPILDGSSKLFFEALKSGGEVEQVSAKQYLELTEPITFKDENTGAEFMAFPSDKFEVDVLIDYNSPVLGKQYASLADLSDFESEIAPCRTFVFLRELEVLLDQGLIKGGDLDNAVVIADKVLDQPALDALAKKLNKDSLKVEAQGILNTTKLHFDNEMSRHKLLDLIGDLRLVGAPIKAKIVAKKPGHTSNVEFAKLLRKEFKNQQKNGIVPKYDPKADPIYDLEQVKGTLPHRYPFLLVDKIIHLDDKSVVGIKNITFNEPYFQGHFPGNPVMPGVLQMEALAQAGGIFVLSQVEDPYNWDTYFLKMDKVKFKRKVVPGDTVILKMELLSPIRRGICHMWGTCYVGNQIVSEGELTAQVVRRKVDE